MSKKHDYLQKEISEIKTHLQTIDEYCKEKEYHNGLRQEKINNIIEKISGLNNNQKESLKNLLNDQTILKTDLNNKIDTHEAQIREILYKIDQLPIKILKYLLGLIPLTSVIIEIIINLPRIL